MNSTLDSGKSYDDEISLVDIAAIFVRRIKVFCIVLILVLLGGVGYAFTLEARYEFTSMVKIGELSDQKYVESPSVTIASLENRWEPVEVKRYLDDTGSGLPFRTQFSNKSGTGLIVLASEATPEDAPVVEQVHKNLIDQVKENQGKLLEQKKRSLEQRIDAIDDVLDQLRQSSGAGQAIADALARKSDLMNDLESLSSPEAIVIARQGTARIGPAPKLVILSALFLGAVLGVFSAFLAEFASRVRARLEDEKTVEQDR